MTPEQWRKIEAIYDAAMERGPGQRGAYVAEACAGDAQLQREVEALLEQGDSPESPLEKPVIQRRFGRYCIVDHIGAGGMGEVFKAFDQKLNRTVAIKVLKAPFTDRFVREARAIAALNHPRICTLYDVGDDYLVMEYVEGKPTKGPMPLDQALRIIGEICDALDAAHRAGIVHRDLKPSNILSTRQGIKLLDFGIARVISPEATATGTGNVSGTPAYMAPEALSGKPADVRSDIYALGCVIHEIVTGARPGPQAIEPPALERVVRTCLAEDPDERWQTAREVKLALEIVRRPPPAASKSRVWVGAAIAVVLMVLAAAAGWYLRRPEEPVAYRLLVNPPEGTQFANTALSPDASKLAIIAVSPKGSRLWLRRLDALDSVPLLEIEAAAPLFWSPDSRRLAFRSQGKIKSIDISSGRVQTICDYTGPSGGSWNQYGVLILPAEGGQIHRVSEAGGTPTALTQLNAADDEASHNAPWFLPDGNHFFFTISHRSSPSMIHVGSLDAPKQHKSLTPVDSGRVVYASPPRGGSIGHILLMRGGALLAQEFDTGRNELRGEPFLVMENVNAFSGSSGSAIATRPPPAAPQEDLAWRNRRGVRLGWVGKAGKLGRMSLSPDDTRLAQPMLDPATGETDILVSDLASGSVSRLWSAGADFGPVWSPDGTQLIFALGGLRGRSPVFRRALASPPQSLGIDGEPTDWSRDGRFLLVEKGDAANATNLNVVELGAGNKAVLLTSEFCCTSEGRFFPRTEGPPRWVAFRRGGGTGSEVVVQRFTPGKPASGETWRISGAGGQQPRWRADGKELFYRDGGKLMAVAVEATAVDFRAGTPVMLFDGRPGSDYVVTKDGTRFLMLEWTNQPAPLSSGEEAAGPAAPRPVPVTITLNWQALIKK